MKSENAVITLQDCLGYLKTNDTEKLLLLYYCRSTPPKSDNTFNREDAEHIMKMKLGQYFMNKGYYFQKVRLDNNTELMVSNLQYDTKTQFP